MKISSQNQTGSMLRQSQRTYLFWMIGWFSHTVAIAALLILSESVTTFAKDNYLTQAESSGNYQLSSQPETIKWNDSKIKWLSYEAGLKTAKSTGKPIIMVLYADWCPQSHLYSQIFQDQRVATQAKKFVMVRVNTDANPQINQQYMPDGKYVPRTLFLSATGKPNYQIHAARQEYKYFLDNESPAELLQLMEVASKQMRLT